MMTTPTAASTGVKVRGLQKLHQQAVALQACKAENPRCGCGADVGAHDDAHGLADSRMMPEFTNPTTITVVAEEDWMTAVTSAPSSTPFSLLEVSFSSIFSSLPPLALLSAELIVSIPYRNSARPPTSVSTPKMSIRFSFLSPRRTLRRLSALCTGPARSAGLPQAAVRPYTLILVFECKIGSILFVKGM